MIIYEVEALVHPDHYQDYLDWLQNEHAKEVCAAAGFEKAQIFSRKDHDPSDWPMVRISYFSKDTLTLESYLKNRAPALRQKAFDRFGDQFKASRQIWQSFQEFI